MFVTPNTAQQCLMERGGVMHIQNDIAAADMTVPSTTPIEW